MKPIDTHRDKISETAGPKYTTTYSHLRDSPLHFAEFGLDRLVPEWVKPDFNYPVLDLGPGTKLVPNAIRLDWPEYDWEPQADSDYVPNGRGSLTPRTVLRLKSSGMLPYDKNHVGGIFCVNLLEHLWDPRPLIFEMARVLRPGCPINVFVPHADSIMYKQDLDHKKPFVLDTFKNLLEPHPYYEKGHMPEHGLEVRTVFKFAVKEGNEACIAQLVKTPN
jgi:SAM-dependent methyltransferase